jgi:hypothetical protein
LQYDKYREEKLDYELLNELTMIDSETAWMKASLNNTRVFVDTTYLVLLFIIVISSDMINMTTVKVDHFVK